MQLIMQFLLHSPYREAYSWLSGPFFSSVRLRKVETNTPTGLPLLLDSPRLGNRSPNDYLHATVDPGYRAVSLRLNSSLNQRAAARCRDIR
jgi:hypothetical protein